MESLCYFQEALIQVRTAAAQAIGQLGDVGAKVLCDRLHGAETGWEEKIVILEAFARLDIEEYKFKKRVLVPPVHIGKISAKL